MTDDNQQITSLTQQTAAHLISRMAKDARTAQHILGQSHATARNAARATAAEDDALRRQQRVRQLGQRRSSAACRRAPAGTPAPAARWRGSIADIADQRRHEALGAAPLVYDRSVAPDGATVQPPPPAAAASCRTPPPAAPFAAAAGGSAARRPRRPRGSARRRARCASRVHRSARIVVARALDAELVDTADVVVHEPQASLVLAFGSLRVASETVG